MEIDNTYKNWMVELKEKVRSAQLKAVVAVNTELISLYWDLGKMITEKQTTWGSKFLEQLSKDLKTEFPDMQGFSRTNLFNIKQFYQFYASSNLQKSVVQLELSKANKTSHQTGDLLIDNSSTSIVHQLGGQLHPSSILLSVPWRHHVAVFTKCKEINEAQFYIQQTITNGWSRAVLENQLKSNLYSRQGKAVTNFKNTLPDASSDLAHQLLKDPYQFDFLTLTENYKERELENALVDNITKFLLELGSGFAYIGKQVPLQVGDKEYRIDLLFYHLKLRAYVVIELKAADFEPEFAGKLSFYLSAANDLLRHPDDNPTIGLMICKNKNNIIAEYALKDINQPIGVTEYQLTKLFPEEYKSSLPTIEDIENELKNLE